MSHCCSYMESLAFPRLPMHNQCNEKLTPRRTVNLNLLLPRPAVDSFGPTPLGHQEPRVVVNVPWQYSLTCLRRVLRPWLMHRKNGRFLLSAICSHEVRSLLKQSGQLLELVPCSTSLEAPGFIARALPNLQSRVWPSGRFCWSYSLNHSQGLARKLRHECLSCYNRGSPTSSVILGVSAT